MLRRAVDVGVVPWRCDQHTAAGQVERLENARHILGAGALEGQLVNDDQLVVAYFGGDRHPRRQTHGLAGHAIRPIPRALGVNVPAAAPDAAALAAGPGVTGALLAIHFFGRAGDFSAAFGLGGPLPLVLLVHDHHVVQQLLVDARRDFRRLDLIRADFLSGLVENSQAGHLSYPADANRHRLDDWRRFHLEELFIACWFDESSPDRH